MAAPRTEELYLPVSRRMLRFMSGLWKGVAAVAVGALFMPLVTKAAETRSILGSGDPLTQIGRYLSLIGTEPWAAWTVGIATGASCALLFARILVDHDRFAASKLRRPAETLAEIKERFPESPVVGVPVVMQQSHPTRTISSAVFRESMHSLRSLLRSRPHDETCRRVLVSSSRPGEGKTSAALGLALSLEEAGDKVLLVDADLRMFRLTRQLTGEGPPGLADVGQWEVAPTLFAVGGTTLKFLGAGRRPDAPATVLDRMERMNVWAKLAMGFDWLIIDGPPVLGLADAVTLARSCHETIFVIEAGETPLRAVVSSLERMMIPASQLVFVLSKTSKMFSQFSFGFNPLAFAGGYGYGYYYSYIHDHPTANETTASSPPQEKVLPAPPWAGIPPQGPTMSWAVKEAARSMAGFGSALIMAAGLTTTALLASLLATPGESPIPLIALACGPMAIGIFLFVVVLTRVHAKKWAFRAGDRVPLYDDSGSELKCELVTSEERI